MALGGPIPDKSFSVLVFNMEKADEFVNSDALIYVDRFDVQRKTITGMQFTFDEQYDSNQARADQQYDDINARYVERFVGNYETDPILENIFDYTVFNGVAYLSNTHPYTVDSTTYPDPSSDPNLLPFPSIQNTSLVTADNTTETRMMGAWAKSILQNQIFDGVSVMLSSGDFLEIGGLYSTGGTTWKMVSKSDPVVIEDFEVVSEKNVIDYGAVSDGETNNSSVINSIGGYKTIPEGVFGIDNTVNINNLHGEGMIKTSGGLSTTLPSESKNLYNKRIITELNIRFPSYLSALALCSDATYLYPQGLQAFEDKVFLIYGAGGGTSAEMFIVVYSASDLSELTVFKASKTFGEGIAIWREGSNVLLACKHVTEADGNGVGVFDITTLPANLSAPSPDFFHDINIFSLICSDANHVYVQIRNLQGNIVPRNLFYQYDKAFNFIGTKVFDHTVFGTISASSYYSKIQTINSFNGGFICSCGSAIRDPDAPETTKSQLGIREFTSSGGLKREAMLSYDKTKQILEDNGYIVDLLEYEGGCEYNGMVLSLMVTRSHVEPVGGLLLIEEASSNGIDFTSAMSNKSISSSNTFGRRMVAQDNNGIINPETGIVFSELSEILEWMLQSETSVCEIYTTGTALTDIMGEVIPSGAFLKCLTGNFFSFEVTISSTTQNTKLWCTRTGLNTYTQQTFNVTYNNDAYVDGATGIYIGSQGRDKIVTRIDSSLDLSHSEFWNPNGAVGSIRTSGSTTTYLTSSDPRLKTEFQEFTAEEIKETIGNLAQCVGKFSWLSNNQQIVGFNAHKVLDINGLGSEIASDGEGGRDSKIGEKYIDDNGEEKRVSPASIDNSKAVPYLIAAVNYLLNK